MPYRRLRRLAPSSLLTLTLLAVSSLTAAPAVAEAGRWEPLGPEGGMVTGLTRGAGDAVWARTHEGGLFRSTDQGDFWRVAGVVPIGNPDPFIETLLAADPGDPGVLYAHGSNLDVWRSADGGATWTVVQPGVEERVELRRLVARAESGATVLWRLLEDSVLELSADGGVTWARVGGTSGVTGNGFDMAVTTRSGNVFLAAARGLFRPGTDGSTWVRVEDVPPLPVYEVEIAPSDPRRVYAFLADGRVYASDDGGERWSPTGADLADLPPHRPDLAVAPDDAQRLQLLYGSGALFVSSDGGRSWRRTEPRDERTLSSILPLPAGRLLAGLRESGQAGLGGVLVSEDGVGWRGSRGLYGARIEQVTVAAGEPPVVYAGSLGGIVANRGEIGVWSPIEAPAPLGPVGFVSELEVAPRDRSRLYATPLNWLYERVGEEGVWQRFPADCLHVEELAVAPSKPRVAYYFGATLTAACSGLCTFFRRGRDGDLTCLDGSQPSASSPSVADAAVRLRERRSSMTVDAVDADHVYLAGGEVSVSRDGGATWSALPFPDDDGVASAATADPLLAERVYVGTVDGALWVSDDGGLGWSRLRAADGRVVQQILVDPVEPQRLYLRADAELFASDDGGATWSALRDGLPQHARVGDLALDPADPSVLYAAVAGAGVWRLNRRLPTAPCVADDETLCLGPGGRFRVRVAWQDFEHAAGRGRTVPRTSDTGAFWFFDEDNLEMLVKVLDASEAEERFWVFYGALTNVPFTLVVTDTATGETLGYDNPPRRFASRGDTNAFPEVGLGNAAPPPGDAAPPLRDTVEPAPCVPSDTVLCLGAGGRFRAEVAWQDFAGGSGAGTAVPETDDAGFFWFFKESNLELAVKVLDGRSLNGHFWVFYGALSNVPFRLTVTDTVTGRARTYVNPSRNFASRGDVDAF